MKAENKSLPFLKAWKKQKLLGSIMDAWNLFQQETRTASGPAQVNLEKRSRS